ncbi:BolA family transcriptional regulator, partial [Escherichia coli]|nr:BolA family transcriptional regulator [Escherichia coli]
MTPATTKAVLDDRLGPSAPSAFVTPLLALATAAAIRAALEAALSPLRLRIEDQSHLHAGHAGARDGRGHFRVEIVSDAFAGMSPIARHRAVYAALGALMTTDIHARSIVARTPVEGGGNREQGAGDRGEGMGG